VVSKDNITIIILKYEAMRVVIDGTILGSCPMVDLDIKSVNLPVLQPDRYFVRFLLGDYPASEFYMPTFRNTICSIFIGK
jgi:hypothetical protein